MLPRTNLWFTKSRRAQNDTDYETWIEGGVVPTLNAFDNGDIRATVLVVRMREGKPGGGKGPLISEDRSLTLATANDQTLFVFYGNRVDDIRMQGDVINTLQARMGTGGNNMPMVATSEVRRLTPVECERLQGFPDGWTEGQSDTNRYKQMGNAVAVPVVEWIIQNICDTI
jgi:site-specific DNA-cytosine methylase